MVLTERSHITSY